MKKPALILALTPLIQFARSDGTDKNKTSVHPEIVDFGSGQCLSVFATTGIVFLFRGLQKSACDGEALAKTQKRRHGPSAKADRIDTN
jgi:hypothetical protein